MSNLFTKAFLLSLLMKIPPMVWFLFAFLGFMTFRSCTMNETTTEPVQEQTTTISDTIPETYEAPVQRKTPPKRKKRKKRGGSLASGVVYEKFVESSMKASLDVLKMKLEGRMPKKYLDEITFEDYILLQYVFDIHAEKFINGISTINIDWNLVDSLSSKRINRDVAEENFNKILKIN